MNDTLNLALIQADLEWQNPAGNRSLLEKQCRSISRETDLIILPEMFPTGFSMEAEKLAEQPEAASFQWMQDLAQEHNTAVTGSIITEDQGSYFNRLYFVYPDGRHEIYDKKHLFTFAGEHHHYSPGKKRLTLYYKGWKICPMICFDLRFPVWSRNTEDYDLLLFVANWPAKRSPAWDALLKARAIENLAFVAGVNRVGTDGNGHRYNGHSAVYDMLGKRISKQDEEKGFTENIILKKENLNLAREEFPFLQERDEFKLI